MAIPLSIKATGMELSEAIRSYVETKIAMLEKYCDLNDTSIRATVEVGRTTRHHHTGDVFRAEIQLHCAGKNFRAEAETSDLYAAIDEMKDEMTRELTASKDKQRSAIRRGGAVLKNMIRKFYR